MRIDALKNTSCFVLLFFVCLFGFFFWLSVFAVAVVVVVLFCFYFFFVFGTSGVAKSPTSGPLTVNVASSPCPNLF